MKITEIDFSKDGKEYDAIIHTEKVRVKVKDNDLCFLEGEEYLDLADEFTLKAIITAEYTEVITPVDYITAYLDCKENGFMYIRDGNNVVKASMFKDTEDSVTLAFDDEVTLFFPDKTLWIKVV